MAKGAKLVLQTGQAAVATDHDSAAIRRHMADNLPYHAQKGLIATTDNIEEDVFIELERVVLAVYNRWPYEDVSVLNGYLSLRLVYRAPERWILVRPRAQ